MTCLNRKLFEKELNEYGAILGSDSAAYYLLAANGGYEVEYTPNGQPSQLWQDCLNACNGDRELAILMKAAYYSKEYTDLYGEWLKDYQAEPSFDPNVGSFVSSVAHDCLQNNEFNKIYNQVLANGIDDRDYAMSTAIGRTRQAYIDSQIKNKKDENARKQSERYNSKKFFWKVVKFFKTTFGANRISNPLFFERTLRKTAERAAKEFDETLRWLNIDSTVNQLNAIVQNTNANVDQLKSLSQHILENYQNGDFDRVKTAMVLMQQILNNKSILVETEEQFCRFVEMFKILNDNTYTVDKIEDIFGDFRSAYLAIKDTSNAVTPEQQAFVQNFVVDLQNHITQLHQVIGTNEQLKDCSSMFFHIGNEEMMNENRKMYNVAKHGIMSRIISIQRSTKGHSGTLYNLKRRLRELDKLDPDNPEDMYKMCTSFLEHAEHELNVLNGHFEKYLNDVPGAKMDAETLNYARTDVIGYYNYIIQHFLLNVDNYSRMSATQLNEIKNQQHAVDAAMSAATNTYNKALDKYIDIVADRMLRDIKIGEREAHIRQFKKGLRNEINGGNTSWFAKHVGDPNNSESIVIRAVQHALNNDERAANRLKYKASTRLMHLYSKMLNAAQKVNLDPRNPQKVICETDALGRPYGRFVSEFKQGELEYRLNEFENKLQLKYGIRKEDGKPVFDLDSTEGQRIYNAYMDELDDWKGQNGHRRYKTEYYKTRRRMLSHETLTLMDDIQQEIQLLIDKCTHNDGLVYTSELSLAERNRLDTLQDKLQELGNPYIVIKDATGAIVRFEPKTGHEYDTAMEIVAWNAWLKGKTDRSSDYESYNKALATITDPVERQRFIYDNSAVQFSEKFIQMLKSCGVEQSELYNELLVQKNKILRYAKSKDVNVSDNLLILNDQAWLEIKRLEAELDANRTSGGKNSWQVFDQIANKLPVTMNDPDNPGQRIPVITYFERRAQQQMQTDPDAMNKFYSLYYRTKKKYDPLTRKHKTVSEPLDAFYYIYPKDPNDVVTRPTGRYTQVTGGSIVDDEYRAFDTTIDGEKIPTRDKFQSSERNPQYDKIMKDDDIKSFYTEVLHLMRESYNKTPNGSSISEYIMPQRTADSMDLFSRGMIAKSIGQHFVINDDDVEFNRQDLAQRPDMSFVQTVPLRWISRLDNPKMISCDIVQSVGDFVEMAENFKCKSETVPQVEVLLSKMRGGIVPQTDENYNNRQIETLSSVLEMYGYGRMQKGFGDVNKKMSFKNNLKTILVNGLRSLGNKALLAGKPLVALKGFFSAYYQTWVSAFVGRQYDKMDRCWTSARLILEIPKALLSIGQSRPLSIIQAAMSYNNLASEGQFKNKYKNKLVKSIAWLPMGLYRFADYVTNSIIMMSTYHAHRLVENLDAPGSYVIMNEDEMIDMYKRHGLSEGRAITDFDRASGRHMFKMYELGPDREFRLKSKVEFNINGKKVVINPKHYVTQNLENRISSSTKYRAAITNGVVNQHGKPSAYQHPGSRIIFTMRGFLLSVGWDRLKYSDSYNDNDTWHGQYNFETGHVEAASLIAVAKLANPFLWKKAMQDWFMTTTMIRNTFGQDYTRKLTRSEVQAATQAIGDALGTMLFLMTAAVVAGMWCKRVPDDWLAWAVEQVLVGCAIETATPVNITTISDLLTSVTTINDYLQSVYIPFQYMGNWIGVLDYDSDKYITQKAYKNKPKWFRDALRSIFLRPTGLAGAYETFAPVIPGIDNPEKERTEKTVKKYDKFIRTFKSGGYDYPNTLEGIQAVYDMLLTNEGVKSNVGYYVGKVTPATLVPKIQSKFENEEEDDSNKKKRKKKKHSKKGKKSND